MKLMDLCPRKKKRVHVKVGRDRGKMGALRSRFVGVPPLARLWTPKRKRTGAEDVGLFSEAVWILPLFKTIQDPVEMTEQGLMEMRPWSTRRWSSPGSSWSTRPWRRILNVELGEPGAAAP